MPSPVYLVHPEGWVARTGQRWKLVVFCVLSVVSLMQFIAFIVAMNVASAFRPGSDLLLAMGGTLTGVVTLVWLRTVKCPACRRRVAWFLLRRASVGTWWTILIASRACPACNGLPGAPLLDIDGSGT